MNLLAGEAEVFDGRSFFNVPVGNFEITTAAVRRNLPSFLHRIVFVGEAALGLRGRVAAALGRRLVIGVERAA